MSKPYGLIIPNKKANIIVTRPSIFDEDSDSDTPTVARPTGLTKAKKQDAVSQQKALEEDPTVFQYDEVFDDIQNKKQESKLARKDIDRKPKYISKLLAAAERRKREGERRIERQVQKEREAEGEEFKDKESFVTSAYKKKLEELKALEEQEKREEYLETIGDVRRQGNLDGFYRHLYDQKVNYEDKLKAEEVKQEPKSEDENSGEETISRKRKLSADEGKEIKKKPGAKTRKYRSRKSLDDDDNKSDSEPEHVEVKKEHLPSNLDADSDFSVDSSSDEDSEKEASKKTGKDDQIEHKGEKLQLPAKGNVLSDNAALSKKSDEKDDAPSDSKDNGEDTKNDSKKDEGEAKEETPPKKPKIDIWKKRTVGEAFDAAVQRYFERKSARGW